MPYAVNNGVRIHYVTAGEGPPMVLVHATPFDHDMWLYQIAHFSTWFRVIAVDMRCFGRSDKVTEPFAFEDMTGDILAVCRAEDAGGAVLMGASVGSRLAIRLGHDAPEIFEAVVVVGGNAQASGSADKPSSGSDARRNERIRRYQEGPLEETYRWQLESTVSEAFLEYPVGRHLMAMVMERAPWLDGPAIANVFKATGFLDMRGLLPDIRVPFLVVSGEFDRSIRAARETAAAIPDARHVIIKGAGHACPIEDPAAFDAEVIAFLEEKGLMPAIGGHGADVKAATI